jgi:hypothetical protein
MNLALKTMPELHIGPHLIWAAMKNIRYRVERLGSVVPTRLGHNQLEDLRKRLQAWDQSSSSFDEATAVVGRERLLLQLYADSRSTPQVLPAFDEMVALSVLGTNGAEWPSFRRFLAALLYFERHSLLPAKDYLAARLHEAYTVGPPCVAHADRVWSKHAHLLFASDAPERVADHFGSMPCDQVLEVLGLSSQTLRNQQAQFIKSLKDSLLVRRLKLAELGGGDGILQEFFEQKQEPYGYGLLMGSKGLQILVQRVKIEAHGKWPDTWSKWIVPLGCDPRFGRGHAEVSRWWGWASDEELGLARQGITGRTLKFFIEFLQKSLAGTASADQFQPRSKFLLELFEAEKIKSARLIVNRASLQDLDSKHRDVWSVARLEKTSDNTSMVCLECIDDVYIIEGTHSFGLRAFRHDFPIMDFWQRPRSFYNDCELRIPKVKSQLFVVHYPEGTWQKKFWSWLSAQHLEWRI